MPVPALAAGDAWALAVFTNRPLLTLRAWDDARADRDLLAAMADP